MPLAAVLDTSHALRLRARSHGWRWNEMKGFIMRTGRAARRNRILQSLSPERQKRVQTLKKLIEDGRYSLNGKIELVVDELIDEAIKLRT